MYKHPKNKAQKKFYKALALTRKALIWIAETYKDDGGDISPLWFHGTGRNMTWEEKMFAKKAQIKRALVELKKRKYIKISKQGNRVFCIMTQKGKQAALKEKIRIADDLPPGRLVLLSFDIPEQERHIRQYLRRLLKDCGFKMEHQSLWVSDKDIYMHFSDYMKNARVFKWFNIYEALKLK